MTELVAQLGRIAGRDTLMHKRAQAPVAPPAAPPLPFGTPDQSRGATPTHRPWSSGLQAMPTDYKPADDPFYKNDPNWKKTGLTPGQLYRDRSINKAAYMHSKWQSDNKAREAAGQAPLPLDTSKYFEPVKYNTPPGAQFYDKWARWRNPHLAVDADVNKRVAEGRGPFWAVNDPETGAPFTNQPAAMKYYKQQRALTLQRHKAQQATARQMFPQIWSTDRRWRY